jgi:hypothetical protein
LQLVELLLKGVTQLVVGIGIGRTKWQDSSAIRRRADNQEAF